MKKVHRRLLSVAVALLLVPLVGCSRSAGITATSLCVGFMDLSQSERDDVVNRLAVEINNPEVTSPLIRPNVEFMCAQEPTRTIGSVIARSRLTPQAESPEPETSTEPTEEEAAPAEPAIQESFEDADGYSYTWGASTVLYDVTSDVANAKPGQALVTVVSVPEADVEATIAELQNPAFIGLGRPGGEYDSLITSGVWVSAISEPSKLQKR